MMTTGQTAMELMIFGRSLRNALLCTPIILFFVLLYGIIKTQPSSLVTNILGASNFTNAYTAASEYLWQDQKIKVLAECGFIRKDEPAPFVCLLIENPSIDQIYLLGTRTRIGVHYIVLEVSDFLGGQDRELGWANVSRILYPVECKTDDLGCKEYALSPWWGVTELFIEPGSK